MKKRMDKFVYGKILNSTQGGKNIKSNIKEKNWNNICKTKGYFLNIEEHLKTKQ